MGKRGAHPKFNDIYCPNKDCNLYGIAGKGNILGVTVHTRSATKEFANTSAANAAEYLMIELILSLTIFVKMNLSLS